MAIEGEALAVAWALEQTRYFTMGCNDLLVVVNHAPLVKILGDKRLDEIFNTRLFRLKERTLMWKFDIEYQPGKKNYVADAVSRHPNRGEELCSIIMSTEEDLIEETVVPSVGGEMDSFFAITWKRVQAESRKDESISTLIDLIRHGFPAAKKDMPSEVTCYWEFRQDLSIMEGVVIYKDRIGSACVRKPQYSGQESPLMSRTPGTIVEHTAMHLPNLTCHHWSQRYRKCRLK